VEKKTVGEIKVSIKVKKELFSKEIKRLSSLLKRNFSDLDG
jgi:hypothetical protein